MNASISLEKDHGEGIKWAREINGSFLANQPLGWRVQDVALPNLELEGNERLIPIEQIDTWIASLKSDFLAPFLKLQHALEEEGVIPKQPRNTQLYEYTTGEIVAIESGEMVSRVHVIMDMRCNHNCVHCSRGLLTSEPAKGDMRLLRVHREQNGEIAARGVMIPTTDLVNLIKEGGVIGTSGYPQLRELSLDGGEPLLDWQRIETILQTMEEVNKDRSLDKMMRLQIYTNGSTLTPDQIERLAALPFTYLTVNYIAHDKAMFDWFTDTPGSYERVTNNLESLVAAGKRHGRERWLMAALVPLEENKHLLLSTIEYLWDQDIVPIVQPMRVKERGEANVERGEVHPLGIEEHLKFLVDCWLWSLRKFMDDPQTGETKGWLWRIDQIFPPNDPSLKKRRDPLRYPFEYTSFIKLFLENRPSYQMLMRWTNEKIDWAFGEYGTALVDGSAQFEAIGHKWSELYARHKNGELRYDLGQSTTLASSDYPARHGKKGARPANLGERVAS